MINKAIYEAGREQYNEILEVETDRSRVYFGKYSSREEDDLIRKLAEDAYDLITFRISGSDSTTPEMGYFWIYEAEGEEKANEYLTDAIEYGYYKEGAAA